MSRLLAWLAAALLLAGCAAAPSPRPAAAARAVPRAALANPMAFLVQSVCPNGQPAWACSTPAMQAASATASFRRHDLPLPWGYQMNDAVLSDDGSEAIDIKEFSAGGGFEPGQGDGGDVYAVQGQYAVATQTRDGGTPTEQYFVGPACGGTGWVLFDPVNIASGQWTATVAQLGDSSDPAACPPLSPAYTQWRVETIAWPMWWLGAARTITALSIISEHYAGDTIADATSMERLIFGNGYGLLLWSAWQLNPATAPPADLAQRCPHIAYDDPPGPGWVMTDCRTYTNFRRPKWSADDYGWP